jgi:thioredoxin reductase (NADPH)
VTLIHRRGQFRAYAYSQQRVEEAGIEVVRGGEVIELRGDDQLAGVVVRVEDEGTRDITTDLMVVSIGQVPDLSGLESWRLDVKGPRIEVDSAMQTDRAGVLAVGDFATYAGKVRMIATAVAEGSTAAATAERMLKAS